MHRTVSRAAEIILLLVVWDGGEEGRCLGEAFSMGQ